MRRSPAKGPGTDQRHFLEPPHLLEFKTPFPTLSRRIAAEPRKSLYSFHLSVKCADFPKGQRTQSSVQALRIQTTRWPAASDHIGQCTFCCMIDRGERFIIRCGAEVPGKLPNSLLFLEGGSAFWVSSPLHCYCNHKFSSVSSEVRTTGDEARIPKVTTTISQMTCDHCTHLLMLTLEQPLPPRKVQEGG